MYYPELEDIKFELSRLVSLCEHADSNTDKVNFTKSVDQIRKNIQNLEDKLCAD